MIELSGMSNDDCKNLLSDFYWDDIFVCKIGETEKVNMHNHESKMNDDNRSVYNSA